MSDHQKVYPIYHYRFWAAFWIHMRPYLLFISGVAGFAGMALAADHISLNWMGWVGLPAFFFAYGFGQALTDCFQIDTDRISAPYRPLSQGIVSAHLVKIAALSGLILVSTILISLNFHNLALCTMSIIGLATYSYFKREHWWAGPFYNAWIVALLPAMGYLIISKSGFDALGKPEIIHLLLLSFFAYSNFVLIGYLKDITADRETGYHTFPVVFGWNVTIWVGDVFVLLSTYLVYKLVIGHPLGILTALLGTIVAVSGQVYAHFTRNKTEKNTAFPVSATVRSFILWHLAVCVAYHSSLLLFAIVFYLLFEWVLSARPLREQI